MMHRNPPSAIAVIGLACRYPDAPTPRELWENILSRRRQFRRLPDCRLPLGDYHDADRTVPDKTYGRQAAVIDGFAFDWAARRIPFSTVRTTDMVHWLALETSLAAVADAGYSRETLPGERTGVIIGNTLTGEQTRANTMRLRWPFVRRALHSAARSQGLDDGALQRLTRALQTRYTAVFPPVDEDTLAGGLSNTIAGRICNYLDLMGGGFTVDGACSSSLLATAHAASRLMDGDLELAIVGGVDISLDPFELVGFAKTGALTDGDMAVYDRGGKGFIPGEGCGFMVLKRLDAARRDGNAVYAVIHGWGISSDGGGTGITAPSASGQALALARAYQRAEYDLKDVDFIEGHGTGTTVGDRTELEGIARVLGRTPVPRGQLRPCGITSLKSIIGHTKAASGIGGLIKAVMAVNRRVVPPTAACNDPHQAFDGAARRLYPIRQGRREPADRQLKAGVSSMGFGGINCHVTLVSGDAPDDRLRPILDEDALLVHAQASEVFMLSAASQADLLEKIAALKAAADGISIAELADISADIGRLADAGAPIRTAIVAGDPDVLSARLDQLVAALGGAGESSDSAPPTPIGPDIWIGRGRVRPRIGFLFPGQGSQQLNMARTLVQRFPWARQLVDRADAVTRELSGHAVSGLIYRDADRAPSPEERDRWLAALSRTENAQPAICLAAMLWLAFFDRLGIKPCTVGGHSLGELIACHAAGIFDGDTLLRFATRRGQAMAAAAASPGAMVSLRCDAAMARQLLSEVQGYVTIANRNSPRQTVVSGDAAAVQAMARIARENGVGARILPVSGAFHSRLCEDAARQVAAMTFAPEKVTPPVCRVLSSMDGRQLALVRPLEMHFSQQMISPVDFMGLTGRMAVDCDLMIEVGPGRVLAGLVQDTLGDSGPRCLPVEGAAGHADHLNRVLAALFAGGAAINWDVVFENRLIRRFVPASQKSFVASPCEGLPRTEDTDAFATIPEIPLPGILAEAFNGVPEPLVHRYLESRGAFLNQLVQADLAHWDPDAQTVDAGSASAAGESSPVSVEALLFRLVAEVTGFAVDTLQRDARLLDDLNLDSIKAGDLVARFARQCGITFPDPALLANAALGELVEAAQRLRGGPVTAADTIGMGAVPAEASSPPDAPAELLRQAARITGFQKDAFDMERPVDQELQVGPDKLRTLIERTASALGIQTRLDLEPLYRRSLRQIGEILSRMVSQQRGSIDAAATRAGDLPTWVRDFAITLVDTPYPPFSGQWRARSENDWQKARVLVLHSADTTDLAEVLGQQLFYRGAHAQVCAYAAEEAQRAVQDATFSHLVAILPKNDHREPDREKLLNRLIHMRASLVPVPPAASAPRRATTIAWIQFGGGAFGRDPRFARLDRCAAVALGASLHLERSDLRVRVVDFCPTLQPEVIAWETMAEMITHDRFAAVGYDLDRTRRTLEPRLIQPSGFGKRDIRWSAEDVILVTGGAKGITAACALAVARETGARMALVGRSPHPDLAEAHAAGDDIRAILDRYAGLDLGADYFSCDMADRRAVAGMLAAVGDRLGPVTGIIHGAGLNRPRLTGQVKPAQAFAETAPKVLGLLHLLDALADRPPKLIVGLGSVIGITGMPGNGWYGFSNEAMDLALRGFAADHPETATADVAFSIWRDEGMGARMGSVEMLREKGIDAIPSAEGVGRFVKIFTHDPGHHQVVVTARMGGLDTWHPPAADPPEARRFLQKRIQFTPGVEVVFSAHLSLASDPYLVDHHFQGSYLFPTVFGLEAMAQAAFYLCGLETADRLLIRDVTLSRPITVDPDGGADITIRAILAETDAAGQRVVHAGIAKQGAGMPSDCFSATLVIDGAVLAPTVSLTLPDTPLPLVPASDLYRATLLFQGPRFQGIQRVWDIHESEPHTGRALFQTRAMPADRRGPAAFGEGHPDPLVLGDPFFSDTLLQSAALLVPQDTSLPVSIGSLPLFPAFFDAAGDATVETVFMAREDRDLVFRVAALNSSGDVMATLEDYRLRILKHHAEYPRVVDLLDPAARDHRLIEALLQTACDHFTVVAPHLALACIPGIHTEAKTRRRELEKPLLVQAATAAAERFGVIGTPLAIDWREDGKPLVADVAATVLDISLSHEDRHLICACGPGPVGCDLAVITQRDRAGWLGLLGAGRERLLDRLLADGDSLDCAGTRIWAAAETAAKAFGRPGADLALIGRRDDAVLLAADESMRILTLPLHLTWGARQVLAITVREEVVPRVPDSLLTADYPGYEPLYGTRPFEMVENGPQGQLVFVQRLPITFQPSANLSRSIYFSNFIKWMGNTREASAWPVLGRMAEQFASGRWGGVTNYGHLRILGEGGTSDQIEILMWVSDNSGPENSTMTLSYDFRRLRRGKAYQRLAFCRLQTTWVEILGPGVAKVAPYPSYYGQFIADMCPRCDAPDAPEPMAEPLAHLFDSDGDDPVYAAPAGPVVQPIVREQVFETSLAHANLVGNIYYANYYEWQGQIRDRFFYELIPDYYQGIGERGELLALESRVDHLREAMPFDRLLLTLALKELRTCSVSFHVDYFRQEPDGGRVKIAYGMHRAVWVRRDNHGRPVAAPFPQRVRAAFDRAIQAGIRSSGKGRI